MTAIEILFRDMKSSFDGALIEVAEKEYAALRSENERLTKAVEEARDAIKMARMMNDLDYLYEWLILHQKDWVERREACQGCGHMRDYHMNDGLCTKVDCKCKQFTAHPAKEQGRAGQ